MINKTVGKFRISVSDGYPVWITLQHEHGEEMRFNHHELRDLEYVVRSAIRAAKGELKEVERDIEV